MQKISEEIDHIIAQSNKWIKFGITAPAVFFSVAFILNSYDIVDIMKLAYCAIGITVIICFVWWFWALRVIVKMGELNKQARKDLTDVAKDVKMMTSEVREANQNLYVILSRYKQDKDAEHSQKNSSK